MRYIGVVGAIGSPATFNPHHREESGGQLRSSAVTPGSFFSGTIATNNNNNRRRAGGLGKPGEFCLAFLFVTQLLPRAHGFTCRVARTLKNLFWTSSACSSQDVNP